MNLYDHVSKADCVKAESHEKGPSFAVKTIDGWMVCGITDEQLARIIEPSDETLKRKLAAYEAIVDDMDLECRSFDERSEAELAARDEQAFWVRRFRELG